MKLLTQKELDEWEKNPKELKFFGYYDYLDYQEYIKHDFLVNVWD